MRILVIFLFLLIVFASKAQVHFGLKSAFELPANNITEIDNGIALELMLGYSLKEKIDVSISADYRWLNSFAPNYKINSFEFNTNYYFINGTLRPFMGLSGGYYIKSFDAAFYEKRYIEKGPGIKPHVGCLFDSNILNGLKVSTQLYYNKIFTEHQISLFGLNLGLLYYFQRN